MRKQLLLNQSGCLASILLVFLVLAVTGCSSSDGDTTYPFDPSKEVVITKVSPEEVSALDEFIIYGDNFGTDPKLVDVFMGGKKMVVVNVTPTMIYGFVPSGAFSGDITVTVSDGNGNERQASAPGIYTYLRNLVVSTLAGKTNDTGDQGTMYGPFSTCTGFTDFGIMKWDPKQPGILYIAYDSSPRGIEVLDFNTNQYYQLMPAGRFSTERLRDIDFYDDGKYMLVAVDKGSGARDAETVLLLKRGTDGTFRNSTPQVVSRYANCNTVAVHPINGEVYFNGFENGQVFRMDIDNFIAKMDYHGDPDDEEAPQWSGTLGGMVDPKTKEPIPGTGFEEIFQIRDNNNEFRFRIHPSGKYAYIVVINKNYILRTDYNETTKTFMQPYVVAGSFSEGGAWVDAAGTQARMNRPYDGIFVKNPDYVAEGREDVYDFYFTDCLNFCVRYLTPEGIVRTYAGRGKATNGNIWGTEDGDIRATARFRDVSGIAYNEKTGYFYVLDQFNARIRSIGREAEPVE